MGDRDRSGPARLAHRMLGDEHDPPRPVVRHPHRRRRPHLPAPRGRDRPERGRDRADVRPDLAPLRPPPDGRAARWPSRPATSRGSGRSAGDRCLAAGAAPRPHLGPLSGRASTTPTTRSRPPGPRSIGSTRPWPPSAPYAESRPDDATLPAALDAAREAFGAALDDDLNVSAALAAVFDLVRDLNRRVERRSLSTADAARALDALRDLDRVLGILPDAGDELESTVAALLDERAAARDARDFAASDRLRDELAAHGVTVEDTRDGQRWRRTWRSDVADRPGPEDHRPRSGRHEAEGGPAPGGRSHARRPALAAHRGGRTWPTRSRRGPPPVGPSGREAGGGKPGAAGPGRGRAAGPDRGRAANRLARPVGRPIRPGPIQAAPGPRTGRRLAAPAGLRRDRAPGPVRPPGSRPPGRGPDRPIPADPGAIPGATEALRTDGPGPWRPTGPGDRSATDRPIDAHRAWRTARRSTGASTGEDHRTWRRSGHPGERPDGPGERSSGPGGDRHARSSPAAVPAPARRTAVARPATDPAGARPIGPGAGRTSPVARAPPRNPIPARVPGHRSRRRTCSAPTRSSSPAAARSRRSSPRAGQRFACSSYRSGAAPSSSSSSMPRGCASRSSRSKAGR